MQTRALLSAARTEKDVENAYRGEFSRHASITSPHGTDGYAQWKDVRALLEFKYDAALKSRSGQCGVLGQMVLYLKKFEASGDPLPNVLFVGDRKECFALSTESVREFLALPVSAAPSTGDPVLTRAIMDGLVVSPFVFDAADCDFRDVLDKMETLARGERSQVRATAGNIGAMFMFWRDNIFLASSGLSAVEQVDVFFASLFSPDDVALSGGNRNLLVVGGKKIPVNGHQFTSFSGHFVRGYKPSEIEAFYASKDRLIADDARRRSGAFFTPTLWVDEAHRMVADALGPNWKDECIVWDPACGTANLTRDYQFRDLILSTAEPTDVEAVRSQGYNSGAAVFAYDFLNADTTPFFAGRNEIPQSVDARLKAAARAGKRLVFLMNPPYAEDGSSPGRSGEHKAGVATNNSVNKDMAKLGRASRQLYTQFMFRCEQLRAQYSFRACTVAVFSKPTFVSSGSFRQFREFWYSRYAYSAGMLFQASQFADVSDAWGISFTVWSEGETDKDVNLPMALKSVKNFSVSTGASKNFYNSDDREASEWVSAEKGAPSGDTPKFSSGLIVKGAEAWVGGQQSGSLGTMFSKSNSVMQSAQNVGILSGAYSDKGTRQFDLLSGESFRRACALYAARKLVMGTWVNDKDEYLRPADHTTEYAQWNDDAIIYALLHPSNNCTAMRDVLYKGGRYRIKNNFWWHTRAQSRTLYDVPGAGALMADLRAEASDSYLATILPGLKLSLEAGWCMQMLNNLLMETLPYRETFATAHPELHLTTHDAGVYQIKALFREHAPDGWEHLREALKKLADRLRPGVYRHGFLRE